MSAELKNNVAFRPFLIYKQSKETTNMQMKEEVATTLTQEAEKNPVFNAVAHVLALRERNRHNLTTRGLYYKMRKEGFSYQEKDYIPIFKLLNDLGLAKAHTDDKGRIEQIREFRMPLKAIGAAACGERPTRVQVLDIQAAPPKPKAMESTLTTITVSINNKPIQVTIPKDITKEELLAILTKFSEIGKPVG